MAGAFDVLLLELNPDRTIALPASLAEKFAYREDVFAAGLNQLVGDELAVGVAYRHTRARLHSRRPEVSTSVDPAADRVDRGTLGEVTLSANWNSVRGWFARGEAAYYAQTLESAAGGVATATPPGDDFWQASAQAGFRFARNRHELSGGVLNITDRDYHLSPLTYTAELPHKRTFFVRLRVSF